MTEPADVTYKPEEIVLQKEDYAYGFIIEVLTRGLYPNKLHVIREYVQNAYDAVLAWRRIHGPRDYGQIEIKTANPSIVIYDNGIGMDRTKVNQYRYVGYSEKRAGEGVGFRGIGKLSGISVAEKLIVTSSVAGVAERYQLVFDADAMLSHILALKTDGKNIPLTELIRRYTTITTEDEDLDQHYTLVELYKVRSDSQSLMIAAELKEYLSITAPVEFDPDFPYGTTLDTWLRESVADYETVKLHLNGIPVFKPYADDLKPPQKILVWGEDEPNGEDEEPEEGGQLLAFCWYCEHTEKGQLKDRDKRGLYYRVKNFVVGANQLPRTTLWRYTPERAFYFWGEIHVCDPDVIPSSTRDDFEHNGARERLYEKGRQISRSLSITAGKSSAHRRVRDFVVRAEDVIAKVGAEFQAGQIPRDLKIEKILTVSTAITEVAKRLPDLRDAPGEVRSEYQRRGEDVIKRGQALVQQIDAAKPGGASPSIYDIKERLGLGAEAARLYDIIIDTLKDELSDQPELYERLVMRIHIALEERLLRNGTNGA